ncbi:MAG: helix-turn-helix transcriptional regulator, partial [Gemmatimonas sp.]
MIRADERLQRLLLAFPLMADNPGMSVEELAHRVGTTTKVLTKDFASLERYDTPAGWVDTVQLLIQQGQASMQSSHFKRPQKLNRPEMLALDLGLGMLQSELPVDERAVVARTRQLLQAVTARRATSGSEGDRREDAIMAESARASQLAMLAVLQQAQEQQLVVALQYQRPDEVQPGVRRVRPYALLRADAHMYMVAWCERAVALRVFRLDRVTGATLTT